MMNYPALMQKVEDHVDLFFAEHTDTRLLYHNLYHTRDVAEAAKKIAAHYQLDERSWFIVYTAAWFHDTGYLVTNEATHERESAELAEKFLKTIPVNEEDIAEIKKCIMATEMPQQPVSLPEKIICDADLFYFGTTAFKEKTKLLKKEKEALKNIKIDGEEWREGNIKMLEAHTYHTDYCRLLLDKTKAENLAQIRNKQQEKLSTVINSAGFENNIANMLHAVGNTPEDIKVAGTKKKRPERGIETMFRIAATNNVRVSAMADNKAHIMITVNAIIISVILGLMVKNIPEYRTLLIPRILLLAVSMLTIVYAVLATRPKISSEVFSGVFTPDQVKKKSVNLLYFGSYYRMDYKEYSEGIKAMMEDSDFLYGSLTKDLYWQGKVLGRKYRLLHTAYSIFMYGIIASALAFTVALFLN